jgi:2-methylcitrate dehydratase PrpD
MTSVINDIAAHMSGDVDVSQRLSLHLLDNLGAWIAGRHFSEGAEILNAARGPLSPLGDSLLDDITRAIAVTRLTEIDDIDRASCTTCGSVIIPASLLMAEATGADGPRLARAIVHGYEAMMRLGRAVNGPSILAKGLWPTYLAAPFGTAAAAAILLELDTRQTAHALSLALQQISGAAGGHAQGKTARWLLAGLAGRSGVTAALLAGRDYVGDTTLLDSDWMVRTHGIALERAHLQPFQPVFHETSIKPWCCAKQTTSAIQAFQSLLRDGLVPDQIASITVAVPTAYRMMISSKPPGRLGRIVNVGWQLGLCAYAPETMADLERDIGDKTNRVEALANCVQVVADPQFDALYPLKWPARVSVTLTNGSWRDAECHDALGDPALPLDANSVRAKFIQATQGRGQTLIDQLRAPLDSINPRDLMNDVRSCLT